MESSVELPMYRNCVLKYMGKLSVSMFKLLHLYKEKFTCPICNYQGPFKDVSPDTGVRRHAACPKCGALERHRLQYVVLNDLSKNFDFSQMSILHMAPEPFFQNMFQNVFKKYISADLRTKNVNFQVDILNLPFNSNSFDFVFASHVLEHIKNDDGALSEIQRILKPKGIAILPVPLIVNETIEYPEPSPCEAFHVRCPGYNYYDKYSKYFNSVEKFGSNDFPKKYQLFIYEDRTNWSKDKMPLRGTMDGLKHIDIVPVCYNKI